MRARQEPGVTGWVAANPVVVLTIAGGLFYVALRFAHETFYGRLGLTPEDVGITYGDAVARAAGMALYLVVVVCASVAYGRTWVYRPDVFFRRLYASTAVLFVVVLFVSAWVEANNQADRVKDGMKVRPFFLTDTGIRADKAGIRWVGETPEGLKDVQTHRLMYLGESGGSVVLYDVDKKRSLRLPAADVVVSLRP